MTHQPEKGGVRESNQGRHTKNGRQEARAVVASDEQSIPAADPLRKEKEQIMIIKQEDSRQW